MAAATPGADHAEAALGQPMREWLEHLNSGRRYSLHTLAAYRRDLARLVELAGGLPLERISQGHIRRYLGQLHAQGMSPRSLARLLASWRGFYQWWAPRAGMPGNPAAGVRGPKAPRGLPKALSVDQAQALLDHAAASAQTAGGDDARQQAVALRDLAMFELFYSSGLRLSELVDLDVAYVREPGYESSSWLELAEAQVSVLGKGSKRRVVPVGSKACEALRAWLEVRPLLAGGARGGDAHALFVGLRGKRISARVVQAQLAKRGQAAGVPTHVHPHVLRHSFASHVLQSAEDLRAVQEMLGHASISTTQIYTRLDFQHLAKVYDKAHPRAGRARKGDE